MNMPPRLQPLSQWICDSCGQVIEKPDHGWVEWKDQPKALDIRGIRIVHHAPASPRRSNGRNCYYSDAERGGDLPLSSFLGTDGLVELSSWIDIGKEKDPDGSIVPRVDLREWTVFFRRVQVPYFEEARNYFETAHANEFGEANEVAFYLPEHLKEMIEYYIE